MYIEVIYHSWEKMGVYGKINRKEQVIGSRINQN
jgi:hypothetical protein